MLSFISKLFGGNKSDKDVKRLQPIVTKTNAYFSEFQSLSNDELRHKTIEFRQRIDQYLQAIDDEINATQKTINENPDWDVSTSDAVFATIERLKKDRDKKIEEILEEIKPEAFAVVKETARRFTENNELIATATEMDKNLAISKDYVRIDGNQSVFQNRWKAAGIEVQWNMVHYDVQLIGGSVLHEGKIAEMATGEGKTLVSTLPSYLNALAGEGVHLVTVNDYLAKRDQEWNGTLFEWLGITVDCIDKHEPNSEDRRKAYLADITYGTNNEFGFDYLRDNMVHDPKEKVQRKHHFAMVDEVDSVLIDDARTPLIISGPIPRGDEQQFHILKPRIEKLIEAQRQIVNFCLTDAKKQIAAGNTDKETGGLLLYRAHRGLPKNSALIKYLSEEGNKQILQKTENYYISEQQKNMPKVDAELYFTIDEKSKSVDLTDKGLSMLSRGAEDANFFMLPDIATELTQIENLPIAIEERIQKKDDLLQEYALKADRIHSVQQLLKAYTLFDKDVEYVVMDSKVKIVDEQTGRILDGRRYSDGLHQAIEAKENVQVEAATQTFATITLQNYFRMYHKLCGMTGTAETEAGEFWEIYKLEVVAIPTNVTAQRKDQQDLVYKTKREKYKAVIDEIEALRGAGRPVLVGTTNVEVSELLGRMLTQKKIPHNVLNAKQHQREAQVVAEAGLSSAVTIATNMAGRGTDIKLGVGVKEAGGLAIIGTERHESRRVDRQLRGRAGRQGDPGSSQFFVSLEDDLMRLFNSERISSLMDKMGHKEGEVLQHSMISKSIERAQKKVEENNFGIRKHLLEYDDVMSKQRNAIYDRRNHALNGERLSIDIDNAFYSACAQIANKYNDNRDFNAFKLDVMQHLTIEPNISENDFEKMNMEGCSELLYQQTIEFYHRKMEHLRKNMLPSLTQIKQNSGAQIENIVVPFTDGNKGFQIYVNLQEAVEQEAKPVIQNLEKSITLVMIDESWKNHLRQMDDLRQSVQMARMEQKDPLLIYKFEAIDLFTKMIETTNIQIVSFLLRAGIPVEEAPQQAQQQMQQPREKTRTNKAEIEEAGIDYAANENDYYNTSTPAKTMPINAAPKIGRNDQCPCGSGKKYKHCHGNTQ